MSVADRGFESVVIMFSSIKAGLDASREETGLEWSKLKTFESSASDVATNVEEVTKTKIRELVLVVGRRCGTLLHSRNTITLF